jgi:hypothetical protein
MTEEQRYERNMGGTMELSLGNLGKPTYRDYRSARCRR